MKRFLYSWRAFSLLFLPGVAFGQGSANYPYVSPTAAASGMTTGLENGSTAATINMMQVRAAGQEADRAAAAAAMARSAESAIEEQSLKTALQKARDTRQAKIDASERLKWQRVTAQNAYNKVTAGEMSAWKDPDGSIRVGRDLPPEFVESVQAQERARAAAAKPEKGFAPFKNISEKVSRAVGIEEPISDTGLSMPKPLPPAPVEEPPGRTRKFSAPKFTFFAKREAPEPEPEPEPDPAPGSRFSATPAPVNSPSAAANSVAPPRPAPVNPPPAAIQETASIVKSRSGSEMLKSSEEAAPIQPAPPVPEKKSGGLFSRNRASSGSGLFGFGKKKAEPEPVVSSGLFPSDMIPAATSGSSPADSPPPTSGQTVVSLPGSEPEPRKLFSLPKPKLSIPGNLGKPGTEVSATSSMNRHGNNYYVVSESSQFMKYGKSRTETSISAVRPGSIVMMTKPGADWATVQLQDGSSGIIQTKNLRGAASSEIPSSFAPAQENYATQMREQISRN